MHLTLMALAWDGMTQQKRAPTSVSLFDQGLLQVLQASATSLEPKQSYVLALRERRTAAARSSHSRPLPPTLT
jgi:hypothetical protein